MRPETTRARSHSSREARAEVVVVTGDTCSPEDSGSGSRSHASVAECTLAPLFVLIFAGSTDRESVIACIVCRDGPVFTLVGVLCAGSFQNGDTLDFDFYMASCCELWASAIVPGR